MKISKADFIEVKESERRIVLAGTDQDVSLVCAINRLAAKINEVIDVVNNLKEQNDIRNYMEKAQSGDITI